MAEKEVEEAGKKPGEPGQDPTQETILEEKQDDAGGGQASDSIRYFIKDRLAEFYDDMEGAIDNFEAYLGGQTAEFQTAFNQRGFFSFLGDRFEEDLFQITGGAQPMMTALVGEVHNATSQAEHSSGNIGNYINNALRRGTRDACWFVRDAAPDILASHWKQLEALAADGSNQFIPALHHLGLPSVAFNPGEFTKTLIGHADQYRRTMGIKQKEVEETQQDSVDQAKADEAKQAAQQEMANDEQKAQQQATA